MRTIPEPGLCDVILVSVQRLQQQVWRELDAEDATDYQASGL